MLSSSIAEIKGLRASVGVSVGLIHFHHPVEVANIFNNH